MGINVGTHIGGCEQFCSFQIKQGDGIIVNASGNGRFLPWRLPAPIGVLGLNFTEFSDWICKEQQCGNEMSFYCSQGRRSMKRIDGPSEQFYAIYRRCLLRKLGLEAGSPLALTFHFFLRIVPALVIMKQVAIISDSVLQKNININISEHIYIYIK